MLITWEGGGVALARCGLDEQREEVELEGFGEAGCGGEGDVDVSVQNLDHIRTRGVHALRQLCLRDAQLLHSLKDAAQKD